MWAVGRLLRCSIFLLLAEGNLVNLGRAMPTVANSFEANHVVPDVIPKAPSSLLQVEFSSAVEANLGNELSPALLLDEPDVYWQAEPNKFYTLAMTDPDVPSRKEPLLREFQHWLVGNIPGNQVAQGEILSAYLGPTPPPSTGFHRYVLLVYQQPGELDFDEIRIPNVSTADRAGFSIDKFAKKYNLGDPIAGNFYLAKSDVDVPISCI